MLEFFMAGPAGDKSRSGETDGTIEGLRTIAINVLGSAGYGTPQSWKQESVTPPPGHRLTYMDAVAEVVNNLVSVALVSPKVLCAPFMSEGIRRIGYAVTEFPSHIEKLLEKERSIAGPTRNNLMSVLVRLSDSEKSQETSMPTKASLYLSENEIRGNLFIFTVAGYETTANTMAYAITTLAMRPDLQDWIGEEIDQALQEHDPADYEKIFPALKRCLAIMVRDVQTPQTTPPPNKEKPENKTSAVNRSTPLVRNPAPLHARRPRDPLLALPPNHHHPKMLLPHPRPHRNLRHHLLPAHQPRRLGCRRARLQAGAVAHRRRGGLRQTPAGELHALVGRATPLPRHQDGPG
jgi:hypothetical protein